MIPLAFNKISYSPVRQDIANPADSRIVATFKGKRRKYRKNAPFLLHLEHFVNFSFKVYVILYVRL